MESIENHMEESSLQISGAQMREILIENNVIPPSVTEREAIVVYAQLLQLHLSILSQKEDIRRRYKISPDQDIFETIGKKGIQEMIASTNSANLQEAIEAGGKHPLEGIILPTRRTTSHL